MRWSPGNTASVCRSGETVQLITLGHTAASWLVRKGEHPVGKELPTELECDTLNDFLLIRRPGIIRAVAAMR